MPRWVQRTFILVMAVTFLVTSLALTGLVLWQMRQDNQNREINEGLQQALQQQGLQNQEGSLKGTTLEGFAPVSDVSQLQIVDIKEGTGNEVAAGATITAHYTGALAKDGTIFESSKDSGQPATFPLGNVIQGWQEGVPGMKVGGIRRLVIPAGMAYGATGSPPAIGPNEPLVFDIELIQINE